MRIGILAKLTGTTTSIIRSYEKEGLLDNSCILGGQREFPPEVRAQVELVRAARSLKWPLLDVRILMDFVRAKQSDPRPLLALFARFDIQEQLRRLVTLEDFLLSKPSASDASEGQVLKIGRLAQMTGVKTNELVSMVLNGLLPCERGEAGTREFKLSAVQRVQIVMAWRMLGLSVRQTQEVLAHPFGPEMRKRYLGWIADRRSALQLIMGVQEKLHLEARPPTR